MLPLQKCREGSSALAQVFPLPPCLAQQLSYSLFLPVIPTRLRRTLLQEFVS